MHSPLVGRQTTIIIIIFYHTCTTHVSRDYYKLQIACRSLGPGGKEIDLCLHQSVFAKKK